MEINIKLSTTDIEKMLGRIYGFKEGSVKCSINGNGEIIATANEFPVQPALYYSPGVRELSSDPTCSRINTINTTVDPNVKVTLQNYLDSNSGNSMDPNDRCSIADAIMDRHFGKYSSKAPKNIMK